MISLLLRCPLPPSTNNCYATIGGRRVLVDAGRAHKEAVGWVANAALTQARPELPLAYELNIWFYVPDRRARDLDGSLKLTIDAIFDAISAHAGRKVDDTLVVEMHCYKRLDAANPRMDVIVKGAEGDAHAWPIVIRGGREDGPGRRDKGRGV